MNQSDFYVPKRTGTYSDVLVAYGLATLLDHIFRQVKDPSERWRIVLEDGGRHYLVRLSEPVREEWLRNLPPLRNPAPRVVRGVQGEPDEGPVRNVDETWNQVRLWWGEQRRSLAEQGVRGTDAEQQLRDLEPPGDWATVAFLGDSRMQADGIYNRIVSQWTKACTHLSEHVSALLALFARSNPDDVALEAWNRLAKRDGIKPEETASQLLNPHQGKGLNEAKANALRMDNIKDRPWPEEFLKAVGLWQCLAPRQTMDTNDWKAYVLAPLRLSWQAHQEAFARFNRYLWRERGNQTALKTDITSVLLFSRAWLDYLEAAWSDEDDFDLPVAPEKVVAGFHVAQFKLLSRNAYTMVNLSFLSLPAWSGELCTRDDVVALQGIIDEHLKVIRGIDETHSDGFNLLRRYRDFVSGGNWEAFFDFAAGYSHEILRRLNDGASFVPTFTPSRLRRLIMTNRKDLTPIVENSGFQNVAYAIRYATIVPQTRKANKQDNLYEVRYGLGAELKRKGTVRDEFVAALADFIQSYNQENVQKLESKGQQMRKDVRTDDIAEVVRLIDEYGSEVVANLLIAYGYAREPREEQSNA
ncbi:MAG: hypothetical protein KatS3mg052_1814 [Candidatus Roseilinea sp.]|nr:MAG: hypothetical protein KatS3mg052_1814 [Candidatus Roseilinea sp.]